MGRSTEAAAADAPSRRVLEPVERLSEILFGLIMTLTFTGSISAAEGGHEEVRVLLFAALSCNVAWGVVDAVMYLLGCLANRGTALRAARAFREAADPAAARAVVASVLPATVAAAAGPAELEALRTALERTWVPPPPPRLTRRDLCGAIAVFLLVTLSTFPVAIPFFVVRDAERALRLSNLVAVVLLYVVGSAYAKASGLRAWVGGVAMAVLGAALAAMTIALGG